MKKIIAIAKWEYLEKVKTKTFIISLIITPLIIILFSIVPSLLFRDEAPKVDIIGIVDTSGIYFNDLELALDKYKLPDGRENYILINLFLFKKSFEELKTMADKNVHKNLIEGYILIYNGGTDSVHIEYRTKALGNFRNVSRFEEAFNSVRIKRRLQAEGVDTSLVNYIQNSTTIVQLKIDEEGKVTEMDFLTTFFLSIVLILLLMMMVVYSGQMLVRSMIEEKSSRLIEMLVSSSTPDEILAGKILGLGSLGMTQILIWTMIGIVLVGSAVIPVNSFKNILPMLIYFILGFLFYTTLFVGIGSAVNTEQEAQQITTYLSLILMLPVIIAMPAIQNPDFIVTRIFSYFPLTIPTVMLLRLSVHDVNGYEVLMSALILALSIILAIKISARIFRIGILSYGNKLSFKEILSWIKE